MMKKKLVILFTSIFILILAVSGLASYQLFFTCPVKTAVPHLIYIDANDNLDSICVKMEKDLQAGPLTGLKILASFTNYTENIHSGAYRFGPQDNMLSIFKTLKRGHQTPVRLVVPSVRTIGQLLQRVSPQIMADSAEIAALLNDSLFCDSLGFNKQTLPAFFIPNTYEVYWNMDARGFIRRMHREYDAFWNKERKEKAHSLNLDPLEVSILASIVEEETANNAEKPKVAGLYMNRLKLGMPLQADPTIKFSLQDFALKRILFKHLEVDSPYNTYKNIGLPPGPIRIPSVTGLNSVLNRADHKYLYMCAKEDFSGTHNFATSLSAHMRNARRYQQALNRLKIK